MKVKYKLFLGFTIVTSLVWIVGISAIIVTRNNLKKTIEQYSAAAISGITHYVDKDIYSKVEYFSGRTKGAMLQKEIAASNTAFSKMHDPLRQIIETDKKWQILSSDSTNILINGLKSKELTKSFKEEILIFTKKSNQKIITEILLTDSLGALVAQTGRATDYYQADEDWWQRAKKEGLYMNGFTFDESTQTYAMEICIRVEDSHGRFIGVFKAVVGLENLLNNLSDYLSGNSPPQNINANFIIFDRNGRIFLSLRNYHFLDKYPRFSEISEALARNEYYCEFKNSDNEKSLAFFKPMLGFQNFKGFGWTLVGEYSEAEVFASTYILRNQIIISCIIITIFGIIVGLFISQKILRPIKKLHEATKKIGEGDFNQYIIVDSNDEVGQLSKAFNRMSKKINEYHLKLLQQTEEVNQINQNLQQEISQRENVQNALTQEKEKLAITLKSIFDAVITVDQEGRVSIMNRAAEQLTGMSFTEAYGKMLDEVFKTVEFPERDYKTILEILNSAKEQNQFSEQVTLINNNNKEYIISNSISPVYNDEGQINGIVLSFRDITEKSQIEKKLIESEIKFRNLFNNSILGIFRSTIDGKFLDVNPAFAKMFHYDSINDVLVNISNIGEQLYQNPNDRIATLEQLYKTGSGVFETNFKTKDGQTIIGSMRIGLQRDETGNILSLEGFVEDITELKTAEQNFSKIFNSSPEWITLSTLEERRYIIVNQSFYDTFGYSPEEIIGKTSRDINIWVEYDYWNNILSVIREEGTLKNIELKLKKKNGTIITVLASFEIILFGREPRLMVIGRDITERKKWEDSLANEKERLSVTLRSIGDGVITTDVEGRITLVNRVAEQLTGWTHDQALGKFLEEIFDIIDADTRIKRTNPFRKVIATNVITEIESNTILIAKDGTERMIADSGSPIRDKDSQIIGVALVFRDITQKRKIEDELQKVQKIESIGVLAGGIAHDFNNILTSIVGSISLALLKSDNENKDKYLRLAENAALRAKDLTHQLLTFSKGGNPIKKLTSIEDIVRMSASFAASGSNSEISFDIENDLWKTEVDEGQISQVINNVVLNSIQAMPNGGKVQIKLENHHSLNDNAITPPGNYVVLHISDTGIGIDSDIIKKIFDPYFTTKQKGSGLGLAISFSIIKKHNGFIDVQSRPGKGTEFIIYLPASKHNLIHFESTPPQLKRGKGFVLIMDDEEPIRNIMRDILNLLGYKVDTAIDGAEAIKKYEEALGADSPFDLVIMDLTIPGGMGGKETIAKLMHVDPNVTAIVSSGYSNDPVMADFKKFGFKGTIAKPYRVDEVGKIIAAVINRT